MEKKVLINLLLVGGIILSGCISLTPTNVNFSTKGLGSELEYTYLIEPGIKEVTWLSKNVLQVKGVADMDCWYVPISGNYKINENKLTLQYDLIEVFWKDIGPGNSCPQELTYKISGIEKKDYEINIKKSTR